jgi:hypothetical protein
MKFPNSSQCIFYKAPNSPSSEIIFSKEETLPNSQDTKDLLFSHWSQFLNLGENISKVALLKTWQMVIN